MAIEFKQITLDNGLRITAEVNDAAHTAAGGFYVKAGTRDEAEPLMGVSHFLEHMMFKGTERRTADDVNRDFDRIGAVHNASTSQEVTNYWAHVLPEYLGNALDVLSDMLRPSLRDDDFNMEKNVILEEIGMYADRPFWVVYEHAMASYFAEHSLGYRILGTNESITALKRDEMLGYFQQRYSPDNIVVAMAGRLDFDACVDQLTEACGGWERTDVQRDHPRIAPQAVDQTHRDAKVHRHYIAALSPAPAEQDDEAYAAAVLSNLIGDDDGSRLYWKLIDPGLADEAELAHQGHDRTGTYLSYASCDPARANQVESLFREVLDGAADDLTEAEVERSRNKIAMSMTLQNESPMGRMGALGRQMLYLEAYRPLADEIERILSVTADDLRALLKQYPLTPTATVRLSPDTDA